MTALEDGSLKSAKRTSFIAKIHGGGMITIPAEIRTRLGIRRGDRIEFIVTGDDAFLVRRAADSGRRADRAS